MLDEQSDDELPQLVGDDMTAKRLSNCRRIAGVLPGGKRLDGGRNTKLHRCLAAVSLFICQIGCR